MHRTFRAVETSANGQANAPTRATANLVHLLGYLPTSLPGNASAKTCLILRLLL